LRARAALQQVAELSDDKSPFGKVLREEVQRSARMNDSHFMGEFLSADNEPCHFHEFVARAGAHGLAYVCDASLADPLPESLGPERAARVRAMAVDSGLPVEQCMDFFTGRTFRRALLMKGTGHRAVGAAAWMPLHLSCPLRPESSTDGTFVFRQDTAQLKTNDPVVGAALQFLSHAYPETRSFSEVVAHASAQTGQRADSFMARLCEALCRTLDSGHVAVSSHTLRVGHEDDARPALWPLAREQLQRGQTRGSNLLQVPIQLPPGRELRGRAARWRAHG